MPHPSCHRLLGAISALAVASVTTQPLLLAQTSEVPPPPTDPLAAPPPVEPPPSLDPDDTSPWRLTPALGLPDWLEVAGTVRARFEHTDERFRLNLDGHNQIFVLRSLVALTIRDEFLSLTAELQDSRAYGFPDDAILSTAIVNAVELLQGYVAAGFTDAFQGGDSLDVLFGRHTMNVGSRRFVARNRYRNTINSFLGANAEWRSSGGTYARAFYTHPTIRLPSGAEQEQLKDNVVEFDEERSKNRFWGAFASQSNALAEGTIEGYYYGLDRSDVFGLAVADRELHTVGARWHRSHRGGGIFWDLEAAYQFGDSRALTSSTEDLDHSAYFTHASLGYAWDGDWSPRVEALFDLASGDDDPDDGQNNRFDTLFGARRFEFGPTGIFGAFARTNLLSPGVRFVAKPATDWEFMFTHRFHFLASDRDAWVPAGLRDPNGDSGDEIGTLTEFRVRYDIAPKSLRLEFGAAYLAAGEFIDNVGDGKDSLYTYVQTNFTF
ncbi:MAG: alginate export family protein [Planctomycetota bacterium]